MKTINAYSYHELSESAKERVLSDCREINTEHDWYEHIIDEWKEKLEAIGFKNAEISFSGFYSQGDGCSFKANIDFDKLAVEKFNPLNDEEDTFYISFEPVRGYSNYSIHNLQSSGHCSTDALDTLLDEFLEYLRDYKTDLEHEIYIALRKEYEYMTSDEAIIETIDCNDLHFLEDGRLA